MQPGDRSPSRRHGSNAEAPQKRRSVANRHNRVYARWARLGGRDVRTHSPKVTRGKRAAPREARREQGRPQTSHVDLSRATRPRFARAQASSEQRGSSRRDASLARRPTEQASGTPSARGYPYPPARSDAAFDDTASMRASRPPGKDQTTACCTRRRSFRNPACPVRLRHAWQSGGSSQQAGVRRPALLRARWSRGCEVPCQVTRPGA